MREIKFRAWHKQKQQMYPVAMLSPYSCMAMLQIDDTLFSCLLEDIELMQYTGLKDKHGKEGYAGDIARIYDRLYLITDAAYHGFFLNMIRDYDGIEARGEQEDIELLRSGEIIGNIYEHPELVKS